MNNLSYHFHYRHPRTYQESRENETFYEDGNYIKYGRAKRRKHYLDHWTTLEKYAKQQKSWKCKRKYRPKGRGKKHTFIFDRLSYSKQCQLKRYFESHKIPYKIIEKFQVENKTIYNHTYKIRKPLYVKVIYWYNKDIGFNFILNSLGD